VAVGAVVLGIRPTHANAEQVADRMRHAASCELRYVGCTCAEAHGGECCGKCPNPVSGVETMRQILDEANKHKGEGPDTFTSK
jgi:hypothetical protein